MLPEENTFCVHLENNNVYIKECFDTTKEEKFLLRNQTIGNLLKENPSSTIEDILYTKNRVTLNAISSGTIRSLPICPTGFSTIDVALGGGLELGQLVSIVSENEDIGTHLTLQMALQLPVYFKSLIINLSMNPRRFNEILEIKSKQSRHYGIKDNQDKVQAVTVDKLHDDGDIIEICETIEFYFENEDTRVFIIDNASLLSDTSQPFSDQRRETDSVFKKLQMTANKLDVLIIILSKAEDKIAQNTVVKIDNSMKAIEYAKTQIVITENNKLYVTKQLSSASKTMDIKDRLLPYGDTYEQKSIATNPIEIDPKL